MRGHRWWCANTWTPITGVWDPDGALSTWQAFRAWTRWWKKKIPWSFLLLCLSSRWKINKHFFKYINECKWYVPIKLHLQASMEGHKPWGLCSPHTDSEHWSGGKIHFIQIFSLTSFLYWVAHWLYWKIFPYMYSGQGPRHESKF